MCEILMLGVSNPVDCTSFGLAVSFEKMARLKFNITEELMKEIIAEADLLWPGSGMMAVRRLVRDSIRRLWRYCSGNVRSRN